MKFIANTFFLAMIWRRYRRLIVAIALLFGSYFLISLLHNDFLNYVKNSGDERYLGPSYLVKWGVLAIATAVFYFLILKPRKKTDSEPNKTTKPPNTQSPDNDPFEAIRKKKKLQGKADQFLNDK